MATGGARWVGLMILLASSASASCRTGAGSLRLVDATTGNPLRAVDVDVFIDDGIRCVTDPCPTESRTWVGRTDAAGYVPLPTVDPDWDLVVTVDGYRSVVLEQRSGTLRLEPSLLDDRPTAPPIGSRSGTLYLVAVQRGRALVGVTLVNRGTEPLVFVRPRADRFQRYDEWGGWRIGAMVGTLRFEPYPMPGPYVPASDEDLVTVEAGATHWEVIDLGDWLVWPDAAGNRLRDRDRTVVVTVEWLGLPAHLQAVHAAAPTRARIAVPVVPSAD